MKRVAASIALLIALGIWTAESSFAKDDNLEKMPTFGEETYKPTSQALSNAAHNATTAQQNDDTILQSTTTQGVALQYGPSTASEADKGVPAADDDL
ncbi:MAG TPA: RebB family R body protein [Candidatus Omnitrophota bacterium]|nr:RebB family R body protein [Candidatus Omnitrophota bacterium]